MGYRQYFYEADKSIVDGIRKCQTDEEIYNLCVANGIDCDKDEEDGEISYYCSPSHIGNEIYEFGKYYENSEELYKHGDSLFGNEYLNKRYEDYGAIVCDREAIKCAIEWQRDHIIKMYEGLLADKSPDCFDTRTKAERMEAHMQSYLGWWKPRYDDYTAYDLTPTKDNLVSSWLYEHTIFDLVRIYKTFDFENKALLFMGW